MTIRHNLCTNPACGTAVTGWAGDSIPTQVTGLPTGGSNFPVSTGARYTSGSFMRSATGAATPGTEYTLSMYVRPVSNSAGLIYIEWTRSSGGPVYTTSSYSAPAGAVTRVSITGTAPANTTAAGLLLDGTNYALNASDMTAVLIEAAAAPPGTYFDGDSANSSWDGAEDLSSSTFDDTPPEGAPGLQWQTEPAETRWTASAPATAWAVEPPQTRWEVGPPHA